MRGPLFLSDEYRPARDRVAAALVEIDGKHSADPRLHALYETLGDALDELHDQIGGDTE